MDRFASMSSFVQVVLAAVRPPAETSVCQSWIAQQISINQSKYQIRMTKTIHWID